MEPTTEQQTQKNEQKEAGAEPKQAPSQDERITDLTQTLQRLQADFENYKKRVEKERLEFLKFAKKDIIAKLLPLLDNFTLAFESKDKGEDFVKGMQLIHSQLVDILENEGLKPFETAGQKFDPYKHEALLTGKAEEENIVLEELQRGYMLHDQVLRHAKVKVSRK